MEKFEIYCDGGCRGNGTDFSIGAFGIVIVHPNGNVNYISNGKKNTTNNEMELAGMAGAIKLAKILMKDSDTEVEIFCDSAYTINIVKDWMWKWAANGWTKKGGAIKNLELVKDIYNELNFYPKANKMTFTKVKGHAGNKYNEEADRILNEFMDNNL